MLVKSVTSDAMEIHAPAKVNLFLQVLNKRPDGYHNISSLMQAVTLFDILKFKKISDSVCKVRLAGENTPTISDNLIVKAYDLMKSSFNLSEGIEVTLEKRIPIAAGLGGGSSDCAATIKAINQLMRLNLERKELLEIAAKLGSDIPFFFSKGQAIISGRGEIIEESGFPVDYKIILVMPELTFSTKEGYADLKMDLTCHKRPYNLKSSKSLDDFFEKVADFGNDFEKVQFEKHPKLGEIRKNLLNCGAKFARMSGSGSTIFGVFHRAKDTERACANNFAGCQLFTVEPFCLP